VPAGVLTLTGLGCPSASMCVAVGDSDGEAQILVFG
jgi:hypothetical protein